MGEAAKLFTRSLMMGLDSSVRKEEFAELTAEDIENLPYAEAVEYLKKRDVIKKVDYNRLSDKMKFRAFTASRINDGKLLEKLNAEMLANVHDGKGLKDFLSLTKTDIQDKIGMGPNQGWYWETVYRTNVQTAYNVGRAMGFEEDKPLALQFIGIDDSRQTEICHSLTNIIRPYDDPFWQTHFPPLHFSCRSTVRPIYDESEIPAEWSKLDGAESPAKGFGTYPLSSDSWWEELESQVRQAKHFGVQGEIEAAKVALGIDGVYGSNDEVIRHKTIKELKKIGNISKGDEMTFEEADGGNVNPFRSLGGNYKENCQTCVAAFEARMKGFPVRAKAYDKNSVFFNRLANNPLRAFIDPQTKHHPVWPEDNPSSNVDIFKTWKAGLDYIKKTVQRGERYVMDFRWESNGRGHIISVIRTKKGKLMFYDPQDSAIYDKEDFSYLFKQIKFDGKYNQPKILRVDNLQLDANVLKYVLEETNG
ncbi:MAG: minor capsid protein [Treponema sp.]|uniref:minor capsid protein n=1 Tax=Treponema sp. TaxID=166 RepID=UPI0025DF271C|nr:minor capsid protein [Treponema sp.]MBQ7538612.1 minor capsid protein [Treponema sp.]MBR0496929.1 minor capsid protein [Treponema sp.]